MGKWTVQHHDEVLRAKIKNMVAGSVKRLKLEREKKQEEPFISYESFVEELDEGDSFTATLIDVLVKEMAERRMRPNSPDRRLISERTAKSLRMQAAPLHVYSAARHRAGRVNSRRSLPLAGYLGVHAEQAQQSEEEEDGSVTSSGAPYEGFRINSELHDAYLPYPIPPSHEVDPALPGSPEYLDARPFFTPSPPPIPQAQPPITRPGSQWTAASLPSSSSSITRQNPIRRPMRSRTVDFNEFTHRRRSSTRQSTGNADEPEGIWSEGTRDGIWRFRLRDEPPHDEPSASHGSAPGPQPMARRFFPLSPWSQNQRRHEVGGAFPWNPETAESSRAGNPATEPSSSALANGQTSSQLWYSLTATAPAAPDSAAPSPPTGAPDSHEEGRPRLRRGGIRPPESLLSRYASPMPEEHSRRVPLTEEGMMLLPAGGGLPRSWRAVTPPDMLWPHRVHSGLQLPTPRSVSPAADLQDEA